LTSQNIKSKLGDAYLKVAEFLIPGYDLEIIIGQVPLKTEITEIEEPIILEIVKQVQQLTPQVITKEVTKQVTQVSQITETIQSADLIQINGDLTALSQDITDLGSQISSRIDYTTPSYAPVYVSSSGLQVSGHALLSTLNVSGSGSIGGSLGVHDNFSAGNTKDTKTTFDVYSTASFNEATTFNSGLSATAGLSISDSNLTVSSDGIFTGNVGIGTTNPTEKLHVVGATLLQGRLSDPKLMSEVYDEDGEFSRLTNALDVFVLGDYAYITAG
ncbi:unnamed protein product, partial [marine sediment metagenome]